MNIAILGGTGKEGAGLAARWALAGHAIIIGSRDAERAKAKAAELREATHKTTIAGESNAEAARQGTVIVIALPAQGLAATLPEVRDGCMWPNGQPGLGIDVNEELAAKYPFKERELGGAWDTVRRADGTMVKP